MKLSKQAKARIGRMSSRELKEVVKAARLLADNDVITSAKFKTIERTCGHRY